MALAQVAFRSDSLERTCSSSYAKDGQTAYARPHLFGSMMAWQADQIQCALFTIPSAPQLDAAELWTLATSGGSPDAYQRPNTSPASGSFAQGPLDAFRLIIQSQLGRLDFFLVPDPPKQVIEGPSRIGEVNDARASLGRAVLQVLSSVKVIRLAIVANMTKIFSTDDEVSLHLSEICNGAWFPSPPLDCIYQINVRRNHDCLPDLYMNRVLTFSAGSYQILQAQFSLDTYATGFSQPHMQKSFPIVSMKVDVNTASSDDVSANSRLLFAEIDLELEAILHLGLSRLHE